MKVKREKIRKARIEKGFSQEYLASLLEISQAQYNRLENGKNNFDIEKLSQIFKILEVNPLEVLDFSDGQNVYFNHKNKSVTNSGNINLYCDIDLLRTIIREELNKQ